jgi:hypothetical protein
MKTKPKAMSLFPQMTVGVMGSAGGVIEPGVLKKARELGRSIARKGHVLITGACPGIPHECVLGAKEAGGIVVGVSPALNLEEHVTRYLSPTRGYEAIIFTGSGLMGREIENIRSCDVVVFAGGRSGTLGEFAIAYDEGKVIGVLLGTGGITAHIDEIIGMVDKSTSAEVFYDDDPDRLMASLEAVYRKRIYPQYAELMKTHSPDGQLNP